MLGALMKAKAAAPQLGGNMIKSRTNLIIESATLTAPSDLGMTGDILVTVTDEHSLGTPGYSISTMDR